ncbi:MAG: PE-PGRS family protein [Bacteroidetes bacterium]|nr:PE-PGRS family protein [Fibrella sp.]
MRISLALLSAFLIIACGGNEPSAQFATEPTSTPVTPGLVNEASGLVDSRSMPGNLWIAQDSGNPVSLDLLGHDSKLKGRMAIPNATNRDWEDLASGPGPQAGVNYLYIAEIGDNNAAHQTSYIYRLPEPANLNTPVSSVDRIAFKYPDGPRDAECLILDPQTRDLWIVSKREDKVHLYQLPYPQSTTDVTTAKAYGELPLTFVTGGGISSDGTEILLRTYAGIYHFQRNSGQSVADALQRQTGRSLPYRLEPQGEAICFDAANKGYFTVSEIASSPSVNLYYYARQ